jgi:hypothetical protein
VTAITAAAGLALYLFSALSLNGAGIVTPDANNTDETSKQVRKTTDRELTPDELEHIAGGRIYQITPSDQTIRSLIR